MKIDPNRIQFNKVAKFLHSYKGTGRFAASTHQQPSSTKRKNTEDSASIEAVKRAKVIGGVQTSLPNAQPRSTAQPVNKEEAIKYVTKVLIKLAGKSIIAGGKTLHIIGELAIKIVNAAYHAPGFMTAGAVSYAGLVVLCYFILGPTKTLDYLLPSTDTIADHAVAVFQVQSYVAESMIKTGARAVLLNTAWYSKVAAALSTGTGIAALFGQAGSMWKLIGQLLEALVKYLLSAGQNLVKRVKKALDELPASGNDNPPPPPPPGSSATNSNNKIENLTQPKGTQASIYRSSTPRPPPGPRDPSSNQRRNFNFSNSRGALNQSNQSASFSRPSHSYNLRTRRTPTDLPQSINDMADRTTSNADANVDINNLAAAVGKVIKPQKTSLLSTILTGAASAALGEAISRVVIPKTTPAAPTDTPEHPLRPTPKSTDPALPAPEAIPIDLIETAEADNAKFWEALTQFNMPTEELDRVKALMDSEITAFNPERRAWALRQLNILGDLVNNINMQESNFVQANNMLNEAKLSFSGSTADRQFHISNTLLDSMVLPINVVDKLSLLKEQPSAFSSVLKNEHDLFNQYSLNYLNNAANSIIIGGSLPEHTTTALTSISKSTKSTGDLLLGGFYDSYDACHVCKHPVNCFNQDGGLLGECGHLIGNGGTCFCVEGNTCSCGIIINPAIKKIDCPTINPLDGMAGGNPPETLQLAEYMYKILVNDPPLNNFYTRQDARNTIITQMQSIMPTTTTVQDWLSTYMRQNLDVPSHYELQYQYSMRENKAHWIDLAIRRSAVPCTGSQLLNAFTTNTSIPLNQYLQATVVLTRWENSSTWITYNVKRSQWNSAKAYTAMITDTPYRFVNTYPEHLTDDGTKFFQDTINKFYFAKEAIGITPAFTEYETRHWNQMKDIAVMNSYNIGYADVSYNDAFFDIVNDLKNKYGLFEDLDSPPSETNTASVDISNPADVGSRSKDLTALSGSGLYDHRALDSAPPKLLTTASSTLHETVSSMPNLILAPKDTAYLTGGDFTNTYLTKTSGIADLLLPFLKTIASTQPSIADKYANDEAVRMALIPSETDLFTINNIIANSLDTQQLEKILQKRPAMGYNKTDMTSRIQHLLAYHKDVQTEFVNKYGAHYDVGEFMYLKNIQKDPTAAYNTMTQYNAREETYVKPSTETSNTYKKLLTGAASMVFSAHRIINSAKIEGTGLKGAGIVNIPRSYTKVYKKTHEHPYEEAYFKNMNIRIQLTSAMRELISTSCFSGIKMINGANNNRYNSMKEQQANLAKTSVVITAAHTNTIQMLRNLFNGPHQKMQYVRNAKMWHTKFNGGMRNIDDDTATDYAGTGKALNKKSKFERQIKCIHCGSVDKLNMHKKSATAVVCKNCIDGGKNMTADRQPLHVGGMMPIEDTLEESHASTKDSYMKENNTNSNLTDSLENSNGVKQAPTDPEMHDLKAFMTTCPRKYKTNPLRFNDHLYEVENFSKTNFNDLIVMLGTYFVIDKHEGGLEPTDVFKSNLNAHILGFLQKKHSASDSLNFQTPGKVDWSKFQAYNSLAQYIYKQPEILTHFDI
jgi:hypothetical protein